MNLNVINNYSDQMEFLEKTEQDIDFKLKNQPEFFKKAEEDNAFESKDPTEFLEEADRDDDFESKNFRMKMRRFKFAMQCLHQMMQIKPQRNAVLCPYSLYDALLIIYLMVSDDIERRLRRILYLPNSSKSELIKYIKKKYDTELQQYSNSRFDMNDCHCWLNKDTGYFEKFKQSFHFDTCVKVNFNDSPFEEISNINQFIEIETEGHISHPVQLNNLCENMELILTNILYFDQQKFEISTALITPDRRKRKSFFWHDFSMHVTEFPYESGYTSLYVLLPASLIKDKWTIKENITDTDICDLIKQMANIPTSTLRSLLNMTSEGDDTGLLTSEDDNADLLTWPTFEVERNLKIRELLEALGLEQLYMPGEIYMGSSCRETSVHKAEFLHRAHVKVTKENTLAGGINVIYTKQQSLQRNIKIGEVNCNSPFIWLIYHKELHEIFFIGTFNKFIEPNF